MSTRPPLPSPVLTGYQVENIRVALLRVEQVFCERYPGARTHPSVELWQDDVRWSISHHESGSCELAYGTTPEEAFAELDRKLGPVMSPVERLQHRCEQLMRDAVALQAHEVVEQLKAARLTTSPVSSPALQ